MKENFKKQLGIFGLLLLMAVIVFIAILLLVLNIHWSIKLLVFITSVVATYYIFIVINKLNKQLVYIEKEVVEAEEKKVVETNKKKILCPKCYHPYDGEICFICGFNRNENKA